MKNLFLLLIGLALFGNVTNLFAQSLPPSTGPGTGMYLFFNDSRPDVSKLTSLQYSLAYPIQRGSGRPETGPTVYQGITITKQFDRNSIPIQNYVSSYTIQDFLAIGFYNENKALKYYIRLSGAYIYSYSASATEACSGGCPGLSETIEIFYKAIQVVYDDQEFKVDIYK